MNPHPSPSHWLVQCSSQQLMLKSALLSAVSLLSFLTQLLHAEQEGDFTYSMKDNFATITKYTGAGGEVTIPEKIAGLSVKELGYGDFQKNKLTSVSIPSSVTRIDTSSLAGSSLVAIHVDKANVTYSSVDGVLFDKVRTKLMMYPPGKAGSYKIPDGVTELGSFSFSNCALLTDIAIPKSVAKIGICAFSKCAGLKTVVIPASVNSIGESVPDDPGYRVAFPSCGGLTSIIVAKENPNYSSVDGVLFNKPCTELREYPIGKPDASYTIPVGVTKIGEGAFGSCKLTNISIPATVTTMGSSFRNSNLASVTIPASVTNLGSWTFLGSTKLSNAFFRGSIAPKMGARVFDETSQDFTIRYFKGASGFTTPKWNGYKTVEVDPTTELLDWTSKDGKIIKANFVKLDGESVIVRKEDGSEHKIPFTRLSSASLDLAKMLSGGNK